MTEYGKCILFDYSYAHFHGDGYGKDFRVLNLEKGREEHAQELLVGGLLVFYLQRFLYRQKQKEFRPYQLESPLWVLLGTSVSNRAGKKADNSEKAKTERTDVAKVLAFLKRFLENEKWAIKIIGQALAGKSGFVDEDTKSDLFVEHLDLLKGQKPAALYKEITRDVFHGAGGLEVWELAKSEGELGLRVPAPAGKTRPYFGVINIGDVASFRKHIAEDKELRLETKDESFVSSLFGEFPHHLFVLKGLAEALNEIRVPAKDVERFQTRQPLRVRPVFGQGGAAFETVVFTAETNPASEQLNDLWPFTFADV